MKMYIKVFSALIIIFIISESITAQSDNFEDRGWDIIQGINAPNIIPSSPQSQIFEKYIKHPPVESNGLPQISIPLHEIQLKGMTIPITLSYHASGIKNKEYNGDVGAGWSINVGGYRVTREQHGEADAWFYNTTWYDKEVLNKLSWKETRDAYLLSLKYVEQTEYNDFYDKALTAAGLRYEHRDSEHDIFTYMSPTANGQYIITDKSTYKEVAIFNQRMDRIACEKINKGIIEIKDPQGNFYSFGDSKVFRDNTYVEVGSDAYSGWMLKELTTNQNEKANFSYIRHTINNGNKEMHSFTLSEAWFFVGGHEEGKSYSSETMADYDISSGYHNNWYTTCFINDIITENEKIRFIRDSTNKETPYLLKKIVIETKNGTVIKEIKFEQTLDWHYLLKKMTINEKVFSFDYYDKPASSNVYTDQWGYYKLIPTTISLDPVKKKIILHEEYANHKVYDYRANSIYHKDEMITLKEFVEKYKQYVQYQVLFLDRSSSEPCPNYFALKKITFPTKGTEEYIYESHQYRDANSNTKPGGGLRIKKIISKAGSESLPLVSSYTYGKNEDGISITEWNINRFFKEFVNVHHSLKNTQYSVHGEFGLAVSRHWRIYPFLSYHNYCVGYSAPFESFKYNYLTVYRDEGKIISQYQLENQYVTDVNITDYHVVVQKPEYAEDLYIKEYRLGYEDKILSRTYLNSKNDTVRKEVYSYINTKIKEFESLKVWKKNTILPAYFTQIKPQYKDEIVPYYTQGMVQSLFKTQSYEIISGTSLLSEKKEISYMNNFPSTISTVNYIYDDKNQIKYKRKFNSINGNVSNFLEKESIYPYNLASGTNVYKQMMDNNIISPQVEIITRNNGKEVDRVKTEYTQLQQMFLPSFIQTSSTGNFRTEITYNKYDSKGNLLQYTGKDEIPVIYLWSYNYQYPIAEIKNATYSEVETAAKSVFRVNSIDELSSLITPNETKLRDGSLQKALPNALVLTYTYKSLVGITSMTDPSGKTTYYEYDSFGRLKKTYLVEDNKRKAIEEYDYNYKAK